MKQVLILSENMAIVFPRSHVIRTEKGHGKRIIYCIMSAIILKCFHIVTHSYTTLFSIKVRFYETKNIFSFKK